MVVLIRRATFDNPPRLSVGGGIGKRKRRERDAVGQERVRTHGANRTGRPIKAGRDLVVRHSHAHPVGRLAGPGATGAGSLENFAARLSKPAAVVDPDVRIALVKGDPVGMIPCERVAPQTPPCRRLLGDATCGDGELVSREPGKLIGSDGPSRSPETA